MEAANIYGHGHDDHAHHPSGIMRWIQTTNHKDIGTLYLWFSFTMLMVGGVLALMLRAELFPPFVGCATGQIPMMIGAPDMAFARMNNWSFWLLPPAATLLVISFFVPGGAPGAGWTLYA